MTQIRISTLFLLTCSLLVCDINACCRNKRCKKRSQDPYPQTSPACQGPLPCYPIVIVYISDGPIVFNVLNSPRDLIRHYGLYNPDGRAAAISEGRIAIDFYRTKYGFDFSSLSDDQLISGVNTNNQGVTFRPYFLDVGGNYRLYMASNGDQSQVYNRQISDAGWVLEFNQDTQAGGTFNKVIPTTAFVLYGSYVILPCDNVSYGDCRNVLNPNDPTANIPIIFKSVDYMNTNTVPNTYFDLHCELESPMFGRGRARGYLPQRGGDGPITDGRNVLTFPAFQTPRNQG